MMMSGFGCLPETSQHRTNDRQCDQDVDRGFASSRSSSIQTHHAAERYKARSGSPCERQVRAFAIRDQCPADLNRLHHNFIPAPRKRWFQILVNSVTFSPDGSKITSSSRSDSKIIRVYDVSTDFQMLPPFEATIAVAFSPNGSKIIRGQMSTLGCKHYRCVTVSTHGS